MRELYLWLILLVKTAYFTFSCAGRAPRPKYDRTGDCIWQHGYVEDPSMEYAEYKPTWYLPRAGWIEYLPGQTTSYDKDGNVIQKIHRWPTGC